MVYEVQWLETNDIDAKYDETQNIYFNIPIAMTYTSGCATLQGYQVHDYHKLVYKLQVNATQNIIQYWSSSGLGGSNPVYRFTIHLIGY